MNPETALIQIQSWAQEESAAQGRLIEALDRMDGALRKGCDEELSQGCAQLEEVLAGGQIRAARRSRLAAVLAVHFGVSPRTLSMGSILERAESTGLANHAVLTALRSLREELLSRVKEVSRRARLMSAVAGHQRSLLNELLAILTRGATGAPTRADASRGGNLVNAEA